jgi:glycosyltransferase involved in cell wall biosynthesis
VLVVTDSRGGPTATQRISFESPFSDGGASDRYQISFETEHSDQIAIATALASQSPDLVVLSRYTSLTGMEWIAQARKAGIPVVFHIDDDLLAVPASLGDAKFNKYNDPARIAALRENIEHSDLCYVSTHELAKRFKEHGVATAIVSGEIYCSVSPDEVGALVPPATGPVIGYMGTAGHSADLEMILPDIAAAMELLPTLNFELFGSVKMPPELTRFGRRVRHLPAVADYGQFRARLRSLGWWVGLAPLEDNAFNRCKADTKWVEYSLAGAAVIASDLVVYRHACADGAGVLAKSAGEWAEAILGLIYRPGDRASMIEAAQQKLRERYSHERLRQQVVAIFDRAFATTAKAARSAVTRRRASPFPGEWLPRAD